MVTLKSQIRSCKRVQSCLLGTAVLAMGGFYFLSFRPDQRERQSLHHEIGAQRDELAQNSARAQVLPEVASAVTVLRQRLEGSKKLSKQNDLAGFIRDVTTLSRQASLRKFQYKPDSPLRSTLYSQLPIALTFEGDFQHVFGFLRDADKLSRLTRVKSLSLKSRLDKPGEVQVELSMNIFFSPDE